MIYRLLLIMGMLWLASCGDAPKPERNLVDETVVADTSTSSFVYQETLVKGDDTAMITVETYKRMRLEEVICQRWELVDVSTVRVMEEQESEDLSRGFEELSLFNDHTFNEDPRDRNRHGTWKALIREKALLLILTYSNKREKELVIRSVAADNMELMEKKITGGYVRLNLNSDAMMHQDQKNDPFHPLNNKWRIAPAKKETDQEIKQRVSACIRFFALYYRDNIKRSMEEISFRGLPKIFKWYSGGIGVYERIELDDSWIACFYNKEQAEKGYELVRRLITGTNYDWPKDAPNWILQTHAVLEQMYRASL